MSDGSIFEDHCILGFVKEGAAISQTFRCTHAAGTFYSIDGTISHRVYAQDMVLALHAIHACTVRSPASQTCFRK